MNATLIWHRAKFVLRGKNAERALTRLKNAKIDLYNVQKTQKEEITFTVKGKQARKVFAIYPKTWYNKVERGGYEAVFSGEYGLLPRVKALQNRIGLLIGAAAFLLVAAFADEFVLTAVFTGGDAALSRKAERIVRGSGVKPFTRIDSAAMQLLETRLLAMEGVSYVGVKKRGMVLYVETRRSPYLATEPVRGDMRARHTGKLKSLTVFSGTAAEFEIGSWVNKGNVLVFAATNGAEGANEKIRSSVVSARAEIACEYEMKTQADSEADAVAIARFFLYEAERKVRQEHGGIQEDNGEYRENSANTARMKSGEYLVKISYTATEEINF